MSPPLSGLSQQIAEPISYKCIAEGAIGPKDWHWSTTGHAPLLGALRGTVSSLSLSAYFSHRDGSRALRGAPPSGRVPLPDSLRVSGMWVSAASPDGAGRFDTYGTSAGMVRIVASQTLLTTMPYTAAGSVDNPTVVSRISSVPVHTSLTPETVLGLTSGTSPRDNPPPPPPA